MFGGLERKCVSWRRLASPNGYADIMKLFELLLMFNWTVDFIYSSFIHFSNDLYLCRPLRDLQELAATVRLGEGTGG